MKIEGLEGSGKGKEEQGRSDEDAGVEMDQAQVFQELVGRGHDSSFLHTQDENTESLSLFFWGDGEALKVRDRFLSGIEKRYADGYS